MVRLGMMISDRYEILEKIGSGGMADVFRAKCHRLNRFVAIKFLKQEYSQDTKFVTKFRGEAQSVAGLSHPNIVSIFDVGEDGDLYYIVMEYIEGITLKKYIEDRGKLPIKEAVGIALQIANGLNAAHSHSIVHRDIKPQNILLSKDGTAKVTDFGIAKAASSNTITSNAMGSVHYISPEQARGGFSDEKSDIYSLGVTMYEMLTGKLPFTGESTVAVALSHVQDEALPAASVDTSIPLGLSKIIEKCMQKRQEQRYLTAAALISDMKMFLNDPTGNYGKVDPLVVDDAKTKFIPVDEVKAARTAFTPEVSSATDEEEGDDSDVDPKLEKALVVGSIVVAIIIGLVIIVMLAKFLGIFGSGGPSTENEATATPLPTATATAAVSEELVVVQDVAGQKKEEAETNLNNDNLTITVVEEESDTVKAGYVIRTNPAAGEQVKKNSAVELVVSSGKVQVTVPNVIGYSLTDAQTVLTEAGFKVSVQESVYSNTIAVDKIASTKPSANAKVAPDSTIKIYKSKGKEQKYAIVPDLFGLTKSKAKAALLERGLKLGSVDTNYSNKYAKNRVCAQSQASGSSVTESTAIDITLSLGPEVTYKYLGSVTIQDPFNEDETSGTIKVVLVQDSNSRTLFEKVMTPASFPLTQSNIQGTSTSDGDIKVYKNGTLVTMLNITFTKVKQ